MTNATKTKTAYECAEESGIAYDYTGYIDSEMPPRKVLSGTVRFFHHPDPNVGSGMILEHARSFPDGFKAGFLLSTGVTLTPMVVAGWHESGDYAILRHLHAGAPFAPRRFYFLQLEVAA